MRFLITASIPVETGNNLIKTGRLAEILESVLSDIKPEAAYFTAEDGERTVYLVVEMQDASDMPKIAEPLFLGLSARIECRPIMSVEDLMKAGPAIQAAAEKYS